MARATFATEVLADAPIGYWRLGEAPGSAKQPTHRGTATPEPTPAESRSDSPAFMEGIRRRCSMA